MARRQRRHSYRGLSFGEAFGEVFGALPAMLAIPVVKYGLAVGAAWWLLKKKPAAEPAPVPLTPEQQQHIADILQASGSNPTARPGMEWAQGGDIMGTREVEE